jgi:hypothetical protein
MMLSGPILQFLLDPLAAYFESLESQTFPENELHRDMVPTDFF